MDQTLIARMIRVLILYGIFTEVEEETYEHSPLSLNISTPPLGESLLQRGYRATEIYQLPEYLAKTSYRNPGDDPTAPSFFQYSHNTELEYFEWLQTQPELLSSFDSQMAVGSKIEHPKGKRFPDTYPFERLGDSISSPDEVVLVDVGGGQGHVLADIQHCIPGLRGKMVLQDWPKTLDQQVPLKNTDLVPYNFLNTEQPIKGARAHLLRHVLADWPSRICRQILLNTIPALTHKDARILIAEVILPDMNPPVFGSLMDIVMMKYGGMTRKKMQWFEIFESVGLEVVKVWPAMKIDSIMELRLKDPRE